MQCDERSDSQVSRPAINGSNIIMRERNYPENCDSTEDMLNSVIKMNEALIEEPEPDLSVFSMDAEALFPSLDHGDILQSIWNLIMDTSLTISNVDIEECIKYVYIMYQREILVKYGVVSCMPVRQTELDGTDRGKPGLAYLDTDTYTRTVN